VNEQRTTNSRTISALCDPALAAADRPAGRTSPPGGYLSGRLRNLAATPAVSAVPAFAQVLAALRGTRPRALVDGVWTALVEGFDPRVPCRMGARRGAASGLGFPVWRSSTGTAPTSPRPFVTCRVATTSSPRSRRHHSCRPKKRKASSRLASLRAGHGVEPGHQALSALKVIWSLVAADEFDATIGYLAERNPRAAHKLAASQSSADLRPLAPWSDAQQVAVRFASIATRARGRVPRRAGPGRDGPFGPPPGQNPACGFPAPGSHLRSTGEKATKRNRMSDLRRR
jgi:hypothetical protein